MHTEGEEVDAMAARAKCRCFAAASECVPKKLRFSADRRKHRI